MVSKSKAIQYSHYSLLVIWVILHQSFKNFNLNFSLFVKFWLVSNYLQSNDFFCEMVKAFDDLSKWAVSKSSYDFIPKEDVVFGVNMDIVAVWIVIAVVFDAFFAFMGFWISEVVDCVAEFNLYSFLFWKELMEIFEKLVFGHWVFGSFSLGHRHWV